MAHNGVGPNQGPDPRVQVRAQVFPIRPSIEAPMAPNSHIGLPGLLPGL